jgi:Putative collagen-binding domain of a collagenase
VTGDIRADSVTPSEFAPSVMTIHTLPNLTPVKPAPARRFATGKGPCAATLLLGLLAGTARWGEPAAAAEPQPIKAPLKALATNPHYFTDGSGRAVYLTGSHTWNDLQDWGTNDSIQPLDFGEYVKMLTAHHHNFTLLWTVELPTFSNLPSTANSPPDFCVGPHPWLRTGPGNASDGKLRFDLSKFNEAYFERLRDRTRQLNEAGIYAGVYFFTGEWLNAFRSPHDGYPFTGSNNVNGVDDGGGVGAATMTAPNAITDFQDAYVRKVIDTLNDLPNVLWIVSEEAPAKSGWWNSHLISVARSYETGKPWQHPIGYAVQANNDDAAILNSDADWIAPSAKISPTTSCGDGRPSCKVNVNDSDHSYFGMWNDTAQVNRNYFWNNFTNGSQTLFMDPYVVYYPRQKRNLCAAPVNGISAQPDARWDAVRETMGYIRGYAERMDLAAMTPQGRLSSTGRVLANTGGDHPELLVFAPSGGEFTVDLAQISGSLAVEWMNPATGEKTAGVEVQAGPGRAFTPPFEGDAVLYLRRAP